METLPKKIGAKLKKLRIEKGYTSQDKFAWTNDIDRTHYSKLERGEINPQINTLKKVLDALGVSLGEFFKDLE